MKRLLLLTAVAALTAAATGCRCCDWLWRGSACPPTAAPVVVDAPVAAPCGPCATSATVGACDSAMPGPVYTAPAGT